MDWEDLSGTKTTVLIPAFAPKLARDAAALPDEAAERTLAFCSFPTLDPTDIGLSLNEPDGFVCSSLKYKRFKNS